MRLIRRLLLIAGIACVVLVATTFGPIVWVHTSCRGEPVAQVSSTQITSAEHRRDEAKTYLTYPEWHIVYAYEGLANTLSTGDEYQFNYLRSVTGFWRALCDLNRESDRHGGSESMMSTVYTIGASFNLEMGFKALYEETLGRLTAYWRGADKTTQDIVALEIASEYALFLQQVPWYKYDFRAAISRLWQAPIEQPIRGWERRLALGLEWISKAGYAHVIAQAVEAVGQDELTMRSVVGNVPVNQLATVEGVRVVKAGPAAIEIETPRYREFVRIANSIAAQGGDWLDIAGNDDILVSLLSRSDVSAEPKFQIPVRVLSRIEREGFSQTRWLVDVKVSDLSRLIRELPGGAWRLEHIHDY